MTVAIDEDLWPEHVLMHAVSWETYQRLLRELAEQNLRLTYDRGMLEIMSPLPEHEWVKKLLARMLEMLSLELDIPIGSYGSSTLKRKSLKQGLEPDECYYVANEREVRWRKRFDFKRHPPPDLAFEVDVSYRTIDKRKIYAALGVPELWSYDGRRLSFLQLRKGKYEERETSLAFPMLRVSDVQEFIDTVDESISETALVRRWRDWVRKKLVPKEKQR